MKIEPGSFLRAAEPGRLGGELSLNSVTRAVRSAGRGAFQMGESSPNLPGDD